MNQCVYCDKTTDLNTQLTITIDNDKVSVNICDEHAEEATIKSAREAYLAKQQKINDFLAQAKALGISVQDGPGGVVLAKGPPSSQPSPPPSQPSQQIQVNLDDMTGDDVMDTSKLDNSRAIHSVGGSTEMGSVTSHSSHNVSGQHDVLPQEVRQGKAKMEMMEGREGIPLAIPAKRVDGTGTTLIRLTKIENDNRLQRRFKTMASDTMREFGAKVPDFARSGYQNTTSNCSFCNGQGYVKHGKGDIECPKCHGSGLLSTY